MCKKKTPVLNWNCIIGLEFVVTDFCLCSHNFFACVHIMCFCFWSVFTLCIFFFSRTAPFRQFGDSGIDMEASLDNSEDMMFDQWVSFLSTQWDIFEWLQVGHSCIDQVSCNLSTSRVSSVSHSCIASTSCDDFLVGGSPKHRNNPACTKSFSSTANWSELSFSPAGPRDILLVTWPCLLQGYITHLDVLTSLWVCLPFTK